MRRRLLAALAFLMLAGCADPKAVAEEDLSSLDLGSVDVETTAALGGIRGVVVDEAIRPIAGATVELTGLGRTSTTDEGGIFTFDRLEPRVYFLGASAERHVGAQASVDVQADAVSDVRMLLQSDLSPLPYIQTHQLDGFIQAGAGIATFALYAALQGLQVDSPCRCYVNFETTSDATSFVVEATWKSTLPCGAAGDDLYYQVYEDDGSPTIKSAFLANPIYVVLNKTETWPEHNAFEASISEGGTCPRYNQAYQAFFTVWNRAEPPEGWSIVAGTNDTPLQ